tara:strand:+ start:63 stop:323 length:261 start_codon:yes stop_codon:yes gene_type:complete
MIGERAAGGVLGALNEVVIDHARGLHKGIHDGGPHKVETALFQGFGHGFGLGRVNRYVGKALPVILDRLSTDKRPQEVSERVALIP